MHMVGEMRDGSFPLRGKTTGVTEQPKAANHTPLPWRLEEGTPLIWGACDPDDKSTYGMGFPVAEAVPPTRWNCNRPSADERMANAAFIVKAANSHEALIEALRPFAAMAKSYDDMTDTPEEIEFTILTREGNRTTVSVTREDFERARAALKTASPNGTEK
jgi:hypothetical protein